MEGNGGKRGKEEMAWGKTGILGFPNKLTLLSERIKGAPWNGKEGHWVREGFREGKGGNSHLLLCCPAG